MQLGQKFAHYFRNSLAAKLTIDFKKKAFLITDLASIELGKISTAGIEKWVKKAEEDIIIVAKTIKTNVENQTRKASNIDDMTGLFYIPAIIDKKGNLKAPENSKLPWIPRAFLSPLVDDELAIGAVDTIDEYISNNFQLLKQQQDWHTYYKFAQEMFKTVCKADLAEVHIQHYTFEPNVYIIKDDTGKFNQHIIALYDDLLEQDTEPFKLYQSFIKKEFEKDVPLIENNVSMMKKHVGQMNNEYSLSPSQRESINHFNVMNEGEILAVNGPPGTGKTTLLQSLVATLFVKKALKEEKAPFIVASSTNNQAVTNIIDSFSSIHHDKNTNLTKRWIEGVHSLGVYFPAHSKQKEAKAKGFHYTDPRGEGFFKEVESEANINASKEKLIKECSTFFNQQFTDISICQKTIHDRLTRIIHIQEELLTLYNRLQSYLNKDMAIEVFLNDLKDKITECENKFDTIKNRQLEWERHFRKTPFLQKFLFHSSHQRKTKEQVISVLSY